MSSKVQIERTLKLPVWIVFDRTGAEWQPISAFVATHNRDKWCSENLGSVPRERMQSRWGDTHLYCSHTPHTISCIANDFTITVDGKLIPVVDLNRTPEVFALLEHTSAMIGEFLKLQSKGGDVWLDVKTLLRSITEEHMYLSPILR